MFAAIMTAALLTGTALVNTTTPCTYLDDLKKVEQHAFVGYCHPLCNLTANEIGTIAHMTFMCRAKGTYLSTEDDVYAYLNLASNNAVASAQTYFRILRICQEKGCNRQW